MMMATGDMHYSIPKAVAAYLASGGAAIDERAIWFRWNEKEGRVESSGGALKATPEMMSRPGTMVFVRALGGPWKRYA